MDAARRQRRLVDHEAEAQVVEGERPEVIGQSPAGPQARAERRDHLGADVVVADEGHVAVALPLRPRLADVVQERAEAERGAAAELVGERLLEQLPDLVGALAGEAVEAGLDREGLLEHRDRVAVDVEMVVRALFDPAGRLELGQDDGGQVEVVEQLDPAQRVGAGEQLAELGQLALPGRVRRPPGFGPGQRPRPRVDLEPELGRDPGRAQQPQRVGREAALADDPQQPPLEVGEAVVGVDRVAAGERHRDRAEREVAGVEVGLDRLPPQRRRVGLPGAVPGDHPPGRELGRELEGVPVALLGDRPRRRGGVSGDGEVEVGDLAAERRVADRPAGDPGGLAVRQRPSRDRDRPRRAEAIGEAAHSNTLGTRAEIPQVIS